MGNLVAIWYMICLCKPIKTHVLFIYKHFLLSWILGQAMAFYAVLLLRMLSHFFIFISWVFPTIPPHPMPGNLKNMKYAGFS